MSEILLLLKPKLLGARNGFARYGHGRSRALFLGGLGALFWLAVFAVIWRLLWWVDRQSLGAADAFGKSILGWMLIISLTLLVYSNVIVAFSAYFFSRELDLIFGTPASRQSIFYSKFIETTAGSSWMILLFLTPVLVGFGVYFQASWYYYMAVPSLLVPFLVIPAAVSILFVMALSNVFPARRLRDLFFLIMLVGISAIVFFVRYLRPELLVNPENRRTAMEYVIGLEKTGSFFLPSTWFTESVSSLLGLASVSLQDVLLFAALLFLTAAALLILSEMAAMRLYFVGWSRTQEARRIEADAVAKEGTRLERVQRRLGEVRVLRAIPRTTRRILETICRTMARSLAAVVPGVHRTIIEKDLLIFFRDTAQWSQLLLIGAIIAIYILNIYLLNLSGGIVTAIIDLRGLKAIISFLNIGMVAFVIASICLRFVYPAVSLEGDAFWLLRAGPVRIKEVLRSKLWTYLPPLLALAVLLETVSNRLLEVHPFIAWMGAITVVVLTFGVGAMGVGLGALYPNFKYENAAQIPMSYGGVLYMLLAMAYVAVVILVEALPTYLYLSREFRGLPPGDLERNILTASVAIILAITAAAIWVPLSLGKRALENPG